MILNIWRII